MIVIVIVVVMISLLGYWLNNKIPHLVSSYRLLKRLAELCRLLHVAPGDSQSWQPDQLIVLHKSSLFHFYPLLMLKSSQLRQSNLHASSFTSSRSHTSPTVPHFTGTLLYPRRLVETGGVGRSQIDPYNDGLLG